MPEPLKRLKELHEEGFPGNAAKVIETGLLDEAASLITQPGTSDTVKKEAFDLFNRYLERSQDFTERQTACAVNLARCADKALSGDRLALLLQEASVACIRVLERSCGGEERGKGASLESKTRGEGNARDEVSVERLCESILSFCGRIWTSGVQFSSSGREAVFRVVARFLSELDRVGRLSGQARQRVATLQRCAMSSLSLSLDREFLLGVRAPPLSLSQGLGDCLKEAAVVGGGVPDSDEDSECGGSFARVFIAVVLQSLFATLHKHAPQKKEEEKDYQGEPTLLESVAMPLTHLLPPGGSLLDVEGREAAERAGGLLLLSLVQQFERKAMGNFLCDEDYTKSLKPQIFRLALEGLVGGGGTEALTSNHVKLQATDAFLQGLASPELRGEALKARALEILVGGVASGGAGTDGESRGRLGRALALLSVHSADCLKEVEGRVDILPLLADGLAACVDTLLKDAKKKKEAKGTERAGGMLDLDAQRKSVSAVEALLSALVFLSGHGDMKEQMLSLAKPPPSPILASEGKKTAGGREKSGKETFSSSAASKPQKKNLLDCLISLSEIPLIIAQGGCRFLLTSLLASLCRSREDRVPNVPLSLSAEGAPLRLASSRADMGKEEEAELRRLAEKLPPEMRGGPSAAADAGSLSLAREWRETLVARGGAGAFARCLQAAVLLMRSQTGAHPHPSISLQLPVTVGLGISMLCSDEKLRGRVVATGGFGALLDSAQLLEKEAERERGSGEMTQVLEEIREALALLCLSVPSGALGYAPTLSAVPQLLRLVETGSHERKIYRAACALHNITGESEEARELAVQQGGWALFRNLLCENNDALRAAGLEGWCNLALSPSQVRAVGERSERIHSQASKDTAPENVNEKEEEKKEAADKRRPKDATDLELLLAFCGETDTRMRTAAAGALAVLSSYEGLPGLISEEDSWEELLPLVGVVPEGMGGGVEGGEAAGSRRQERGDTRLSVQEAAAWAGVQHRGATVLMSFLEENEAVRPEVREKAAEGLKGLAERTAALMKAGVHEGLRLPDSAFQELIGTLADFKKRTKR
uniref:UNC-45/Cro1/She4 central domain-containing protein n=1 Tax=Chromera velia CCMP2878 TaxID=1169474 RepID=A0A0G4FLR2_9ALVE|eukprot:Cvel_17580.t1-p1 / transcript=Cvel_17580.t1 / gene=Cvel_17580 / organism=Chromera_velia_CCMP2878 / gene_product=Protein unc-45 homolog B, putative / transcript_product=Protein unc-45 homolog B, putative / location=Cvel_scaffold1413:432-8209(-) / protein_length=1055 / sequence_SO=supercontig / SO=protein_coding / is_pseudo=false